MKIKDKRDTKIEINFSFDRSLWETLNKNIY